MTFGLGAASLANEVRVRWPSGKISEIKELKSGQTYKVDENDAKAATTSVGK